MGNLALIYGGMDSLTIKRDRFLNSKKNTKVYKKFTDLFVGTELS